MKYLILILLLTACTHDCGQYSTEDCPSGCELCGDSIVSSYASCHSKEFCRNTADCNSREMKDCTGICSVCPPCIECSSISCQTVEFCESIGFDSSWYERVSPK